MVKKSSSTECKFCSLKDNEIVKLNKKMVDLEFKLEGGKKKKIERTPEEIEEIKKKNEEKQKAKEQREIEFKKALEENKKLKNELLMKFGVNYN
jgi:hypothetical protein